MFCCGLIVLDVMVGFVCLYCWVCCLGLVFVVWWLFMVVILLRGCYVDWWVVWLVGYGLMLFYF